MIGYKYVGAGVAADRTAAGALRIGTLQSFASIEAARADGEEGMLWAEVNSSFTDLPEGTPIYGGQLISGGGAGTLEFVNCTMVREVPPAYAFCCSKSIEVSEQKAEMRAKVLYRITDVSALRRELTYAHYQLRGQSWAGDVEYGTRQLADTPFDFPATGNPFLKEARHAWEDEYRIVWRPVLEPTEDAPLEPIDLPPNPRIAALIEKVRDPLSE